MTVNEPTENRISVLGRDLLLVDQSDMKERGAAALQKLTSAAPARSFITSTGGFRRHNIGVRFSRRSW